MKPLDSTKIPIQCPECGHELHEAIGRLYRNPDVRCPACRATFDVDVTELDEAIRLVRKDLGDLKRKAAVIIKG